ncbi:MAG: NYN domain-containing protein [Actinomycetota bacterium]
MGDRHPLDDPVALELLRPALERAFVTIRSGVRARPPVEPPPSLRPFLRFTRLKGRALAAVRAAVDGDDDVRLRVVEAVGDDDLGLAPDLWLRRPDGWEEALAELVDEQRDADAARADDKAADDLGRKLDSLTAELERVTEVQRRAAADLEDVRTELATERRRRREAEERALEVDERLDVVGRRAVAAEERANTAEATLGEERARLKELRAELAALEAAPAPAPSASPTAPVGDEPTAPDSPPAVPTVPLAEMGEVIAQAAAGADQLARSLAALTDVLGGGSAELGEVTRLSTRRARAQRRRRRPLALPGLMEEDDEAVGWLFRTEALVLVDGYNVSISAWPDTGLGHQRDRLVSLLGEEVGRSGADVRIVFDGADVDRGDAARLRCPVAIEFTDADVEADDRIIELVHAEPAERPVVVVSSDRRVRDGARSGGANVVSSEQLLRHLGVARGA